MKSKEYTTEFSKTDEILRPRFQSDEPTILYTQAQPEREVPFFTHELFLSLCSAFLSVSTIIIVIYEVPFP